MAGTLDPSPLQAVLATVPARPLFLRFLARSALEFHPPPAIVLRLRGDAGRIDLKAHGIAPVVFLARCYGLELGGAARSTLEPIGPNPRMPTAAPRRSPASSVAHTPMASGSEKAAASKESFRGSTG